MPPASGLEEDPALDRPVDDCCRFDDDELLFLSEFVMEDRNPKLDPRLLESGLEGDPVKSCCDPGTDMTICLFEWKRVGNESAPPAR